MTSFLDETIALFLDSELWKHFLEEFGEDRAERELIDFSLALINNVHVLYQQPSIQPKLDIVLVRHELWKSQPLELTSLRHKSGQAQLLLDGFCTYQLTQNPGNDGTPGHWDHAVLLTGYDIYHTTSSVAGVAPVARMCDKKFTCALVEGLHLGRSFVLAHEMGHNLGMVHDGVQNLCERSCCLMSAVNGAGKTTWSACSVREYNAYLQSLNHAHTPPNCLSDGHSHDGIAARDHKMDGRLPGQRYTADQQCAFFWGRDFSHEVPAGRRRQDICNILWCGNGGSTISTAHPALDGTWCGGENWCIGGECVPWNSNQKPSVVDGKWSAWTQLPSTRCSSCKVTGGLRIRREHRICDSPAPNNGGSNCFGSETRGVVCSDSHACTGFTPETYGDSLCSSFKDPTSTCKVWCHLIGSDLIRNKAQFPDGTPCDRGGYCVNGICMVLECNDKAVVLDPQDCPSSQKKKITPPKVERTISWGSWSIWTECSQTCDNGVRSRDRVCLASYPTICTGDKKQTESCKLAECPTWSEWSSWSSCSATCGDDLRVDTKFSTRTCNTGFGCIGKSLRHEKCDLPRCAHWIGWSPWGKCSKSCGTGEKIRTRGCAGGLCQGDAVEVEFCNRQPCPQWSSWSQWNQCSRSCGSGLQLRSRHCAPNGFGCDGLDAESRRCNDQHCPEWTSWSQWTKCTVTCGGGEKLRHRDCLPEGFGCPPGPDAESEKCNGQECPGTWSEWEPWQTCSTSCGSGVSTRIRLCNGKNCSGLSQQVQGCSGPECSEWSSWESWSKCSSSCGNGEQTRSRKCSPDAGGCLGPNKETQKCSERDCPVFTPVWEDWGPWSECSVSCGFGSQTRLRDCPGSANAVVIVDSGPRVINNACGGNSQERKTCYNECRNEQSWGKWGAWTLWSECSVTCGIGFQQKTRQCLGPNICIGNSKQTLTCQENGCSQLVVGRYQTWEQWTKCSQPCGGGLKQRIRHCNGQCPPAGLVDTLQVRICNDNPCNTNSIGEWGSWSDWSFCNVKCGGGTSSRNRQCLSGDCSGAIEETIPCNTASCNDNNSIGWKLSPNPDVSGNPNIKESIVFNSNPDLDKIITGPDPNDENKVETPTTFKPNVGIQILHPEHPDPDEVMKKMRSDGNEDAKTKKNKSLHEKSAKIANPDTEMSFGSIPDAAKIITGPDPRVENSISSGPENSLPKHPEWSSWTSWSGCSCFNQKRVRRRYCQVFEPQILGYCIGPIHQEETCKPDTCKPIAGEWAEWSPWSSCSINCGKNSTSIRHRICSEPFPINRGPYCKGKSFETKQCSSVPDCSGILVHGSWSNWIKWSACSVTCGKGHRSRTRYCTKPPPANGGNTCAGSDFDLEECHMQAGCNSIDGKWSGWTSWSPCGQTCGFAFQTRDRYCNKPSPKDGGRPCRGLSYMTKVCTLSKCPNGIDGGWTTWESWSHCSSNCDYGVQSRNRTCGSPKPKNGGYPCLGIIHISGAATYVRTCTNRRKGCSNTLQNQQKMEQMAKQWEMPWS